MAMCTGQEGRLTNPFVNCRGAVDPEAFIGREKDINNVRNLAKKGANVSIVGLPRIGKSSLINMCFVEGKSKLIEDKCLPVVVSAGSKNDETDLWAEIVDEINKICKDFAKKAAPDDYELQFALQDVKDSFNEFQNAQGVSTLRQKFKNFLEQIKTKLGYKTIICIDEFQEVEAYFKKQSFFVLRELCDKRLAAFVTAGRKSFNIIELCCHETPYFYNAIKEIVLKGFSDDDVELYWKRYLPIIPIKDEEREAYRELATYYAGSHPCLLNCFNNHAWDLLAEKGMDFEVTRLLVEDNFRREMEMDLDYQNHILETENILDTAIRLIKEPIILDHLDQVKEDAKRLRDLGFLRQVTPEEKFALFNQDVGPTFTDESQGLKEYKYICFSNYFTGRFYFRYVPQTRLRYEDLWNITENKMRTIILAFMVEHYGAESIKCAAGDSNLLDTLQKQFPEIFVESKSARALAKFVPMYAEPWIERHAEHIRSLVSDLGEWYEKALSLAVTKGRQIMSFKEQASYCLLKFTTTGEIFHSYIKLDWDWYGQIFEEELPLWSQKYARLNELRNPIKHGQDERLRHYQEEARPFCETICRKIDEFLANHEHLILPPGLI